MSLGVRGKEIACLDAAIGPQACLSAVTDEKEREREREREIKRDREREGERFT